MTVPSEIEHLLTHADWLARLARRLVADPAAADDLVQETWVAALRRPPDKDRPARPWLWSVVRRLAALRSRREGVRCGHRPGAGDPAPPADEAAAQVEQERALADQVLALEEPYRSTILLRYYSGMSAAQIALQLGVPAGTVRTHLKRGLEHLRVRLDRASGGDGRSWITALVPLCTQTGAPVAEAVLMGGGLVMKSLAGVALVAAALVVALMWGLSPARQASPTDTAGVGNPGQEAEVAPREPEAAGPGRVALATPSGSEGSAPRFGSLVVHARWSDGAPAAGIGLILQPLMDPLGERRVQSVTSDEDGVARATHIHQGRVRIQADRGVEQVVQVIGGQEMEIVFELPRGVDIEGMVTDASGEPIPGAAILLVAGPHTPPLERRDWLTTRVVGHTAADGWYFVRAVGDTFALSARGGGYMPAYLEPLKGKAAEGGVQRIDFVLAFRGLALRGVVLDPEREPVAGALVAVGDNQGSSNRFADGSSKEGLGMPVAETAVDGTFEAPGVLQTGGLHMPVAVMAEGFPIWCGAVAGDLGSSSFAEIVLEAPGAVEGVVRDPSGTPVGGSVVRVLELSGRSVRDLPFPLPRAELAEDGSFRLGLVAPGLVPIRVDPPARTDPASPELGPGFALVQVRPGEATRLDLVLPAGDTIRGRVQDAHGRPLSGYRIRWMSQAHPVARGPVDTDEDGHFELPGCNEPPYTLMLLEPGAWKACSREPDVAPGPEEVPLIAPQAASVTGFFFDDGGRMPQPSSAPERRSPILLMRATPGVSIFLSERSGQGGSNAEFSDGHFVFERVPPGTYRLTIRNDGSLIHRSEWFDLGPGEHRNLGTIRSQPAGSLAVELTHQDRAAHVSAVIRATDYDVVSFVRPRGTDLVAEELSPGTWYLDIDAGGMATVCLPVEIRSGQETRVRIRLEPGTDRTITFAAVDPDARWNELRVSVRDAGERIFLAQRIAPPFGAGQSVLVRLPAGTVFVEATTDTGLVASGKVDVLDLTPQDAPIVINLR